MGCSIYNLKYPTPNLYRRILNINTGKNNYGETTFILVSEACNTYYVASGMHLPCNVEGSRDFLQLVLK